MNKWLRYFADQLDNFNPSTLARRILKVYHIYFIFYYRINDILLILFFIMNESLRLLNHLTKIIQEC